MPPARPALPRPTGLTAFRVIWLGQLISILATNMTQFGLTIWVFEKTGSTLALGAMVVCSTAPQLFMLPLAGALVDRYDRKWTMLVSDALAALSTLGLLGLHVFGQLEIWHLYIAASLTGLGNAFQGPAYAAALTQMLPKTELSRANGLMSLRLTAPGVFAPLLAGWLLPSIGLAGLLVIDLVTFGLAVATLLVVVVPPLGRPPVRRPLREDAVFGWHYLRARPGLLGLQLVFTVGLFFMGLVAAATNPLMLLRTDNNTAVLGTVRAMAGAGSIVGSVLVSVWSGFQRRIHGVLLGWALASVFFALFGVAAVGPEPGWLQTLWWGGMIAAWRIVAPFINVASTTIWQAQVPHEMQGRVSATRELIGNLTIPFTPLLAGLLADHVLEPWARQPTPWFQSLSPLIGTGPGSGLALLIVVSGVGCIAASLAGYLFPALRNVEDRQPPPLPETEKTLPQSAV